MDIRAQIHMCVFIYTTTLKTDTQYFHIFLIYRKYQIYDVMAVNSFLVFHFFIGAQLLYTAVSVSAIQQSESAIRINPLFRGFPSLIRSPQSAEYSSPCYRVGSHQLCILYTAVCMCQSQFPNSSHPLAPLWYPCTCSLHLCLYFCFTKKIIYTIFLDFTYMH